MRIASLVLVLALVLAGPVSTVFADSGTISRDSRGPQPMRTADPLGGPPTPRIFRLGQASIFCAGLTLLVVAAGLGVYTLVAARPIDS